MLLFKSENMRQDYRDSQSVFEILLRQIKICCLPESKTAYFVTALVDIIFQSDKSQYFTL